uniref:snaclec agglucetin subunit alpha-1-like n=1 Tax=Semicossyphus pulcher TaxID=241346 RepID=UPI0037E7B5F1
MVFVRKKKTWEEAMEHCHQMEKELVSLPSKSALEEVLKVSRTAQTDRVWTGLRYLADTWLWVKGGKVKREFWGQGETPNCPALSRRCGALSLDGEHWESWDCADELDFVCQ